MGPDVTRSQIAEAREILAQIEEAGHLFTVPELERMRRRLLLEIERLEALAERHEN